jgi:hypothetical protein
MATNLFGKRNIIVRSFDYKAGEGKVEIVRAEWNGSKNPPGYENTKLQLDPLKVRAAFDAKNLMLAYFAYLKGIGIDMRGAIPPGGEWGPWPKKLITPDKKEHKYKKGCRVLAKLDDEDEARDWVITNDALWDQMALLHGKWFDHRHEHHDEVPMFGFIGIKPMAGHADNSTIYVPTLGLLDYEERPRCLPDTPAVKPPVSDTMLDAFRRGTLDAFKKKGDDDDDGGDYGGDNRPEPPPEPDEPGNQWWNYE